MHNPNFDPYAPPAVAHPHAPPPGSIIREGDILVVPQTAAAYFPSNICIKCGRPAKKALTRNLIYYHPALILLILAGLIVFVIVVLCVQKKIRLRVGLCEEHKAKRGRMVLTAWLLLGGAIGACFLFANLRGSYPGVAFLTITGLFLASIIMAFVNSRWVVSAKHIDDYQARLKGVGRPFLNHFPGR